MGYLYEKEIAWRSDGVLPDDRFVDVHFDELVRDPVTTIERIYRRLGWELSQDTRERVGAYASSKPKDSRGAHRYSLEDVGLDEGAERDRFAFYTKHYGVREE